MQEVCSTLDSTQMGAQIKSESPLNPLQVQTGQTTVVPLVAGPGGPQPQGPPPAVMLVNKMAPNCDKRAADTAYWMASEGGFINSQPSMAEFLNHLSPESPKIGTPVGVGVGGVVGGAGSGAGGYPVGVGVGVPQTPDGMDSVPEYPWMKEKKTSRKSSNNNNQGKYLRQDEEPQSRTGNATAAANAKLALIKKSMQQAAPCTPVAIPFPIPILIPLTLDSNKPTQLWQISFAVQQTAAHTQCHNPSRSVSRSVSVSVSVFSGSAPLMELGPGQAQKARAVRQRSVICDHL